MVTITANNDGPFIVNETEGSGDVDGNVLSNDTIDGDNFFGNVVEVNGSPAGVGIWIDGPNGGRIKIDANGSFDFDADGDFAQLLNGETVRANFDYTISTQDRVAPQKTNVVFVIDQSGSTANDFLNPQDLLVNNPGVLSKLDAELLAVQNLVTRIDALNLPAGSIDIGLVFFSDAASTYSLSDPSDDLSGIFVDIAPLSGTNYDAGLAATGVWFEENADPVNDNNIIFFLSDGEPNSGQDGVAEAKILESNYSTQIVAVGIGDNVTTTTLDALDNTGGSEVIYDTAALDDSLFTGLTQTINITDTATLSIDVIGLGNSISGTYFLDVDYNGVFNGADSTIAGKNVQLLDANGQVILSKSTDSNGFYSFDNLLQGTYRVQFENSRPTEDFIPPSGAAANGSNVVDPVAGTTALISLDAGTDASNINAGVAVQTGGIFGTVFEDLNANNIYDASDRPIAGVGVELLDLEGSPTDSATVTDTQGNYNFTGMIPADYQVVFTNPANKLLVMANAGNDDTIDSDAVAAGSGTSRIPSVTVTAGSNVDFNDAGFRDLTSQISNINLNTPSGALTFNDPVSFSFDYSIDPLGTPVQIIATPLESGKPLTNDATVLGFNPGSSGTASGTLSVSGTGNQLATVDGVEVKVVETGNPSNVLSTSTIGANYTFDAGNLSVDGTVFSDLNADGINAQEPGRSGVQVELLDGSGTLIATTTSGQGPQGDFSFSGLNSGQYQLRFPTTDNGLVLSPQTSGGSAPNISNGLTSIIFLDPFAAIQIDAGYSDPMNGGISGRAFEDLNGNNLFDAGDAGIAGLNVELLDASDGSVEDQTTTGSGGAYSFSALPSGSYVVKFPTNAGAFRAPVTRDSGASDNIDSDINQTTGQTGSVTLAPGGSFQNVDAGYVSPASGPARVVDLASDAQSTYWGDAQDDRGGWSVSGLGDINNDGIDDFAISAHWESTTASRAGEVYVVFGSGALPSASTLGSIADSDGFAIKGTTASGLLGEDISPAGDFNGDGIDDFIIGAQGENAAHVIFGQIGATRPDAAIDSLGSGGVTFSGSGDAFGGAVSSAGDVNNDGFDDILVGAWGASEAFLIYGQSSGYYSGTVSVSSLSQSEASKFIGGPGDNSGVSLHGIGDFNNDGFDDLAIGAETASRGGKKDVGATYVIFGAATALPALIDLTTDSDLEFIGGNAGDMAGHAVQGGFDFNDDTIADLLIGAPNADPNNLSDAGAAYVIYGGSNLGTGSIALDQMNTSAGLIINGVSAGSNFGGAVASAGEFNSDTISDIIIGAENYSAGSNFGAGRSYVLFGQSGTPSGLALDNLKSDQGAIFDGAGSFNYSGKAVAGLGDINSDGKDDIAIGAHLATINGIPRAGIVHIVSDNLPPPNPSNSVSIVNSPFSTSGIFAQGSDDNNETFVTGSGSDTIETGAGNDQVASGGGNDILQDSNGDDILDADAGDDILISLAGQNRLFGGNGSDILIGGFGADSLDGGAGDDLIIGDLDGLYFGNDTIIGGVGDDLLQGAAGADTFVFRTNDGNDEIAQYARDYANPLNSSATAADFEVGLDTINLLGFGYMDAADALANLSDVAGTAQFSDQGTTINFHGLTTADLSDPNLTVFVI